VLQLQHRLVQSAAAQLGRHALDSDAAATISQSTGLPGLVFEAEPTTNGRAQQAIMDTSGRIAGFFTRDAPQSSRTVEQLGIILATSLAALLLFTGAALWHLRRARRNLQAAETRAALAAEVDKLTRLPNHGKMLDLLEDALQRRALEVFAVIEVDGLNNGVLGATELIGAIGQRLRESLPQGAALERPNLQLLQPQHIRGVLRRVLDQLERPYWVEKVVRLTMHAGFAQAPEHATSRSSAIKKGPGSLVAFDPTIDRQANEQRFVHQDLPRALAANELELHFQPIVTRCRCAIATLSNWCAEAWLKRGCRRRGWCWKSQRACWRTIRTSWFAAFRNCMRSACASRPMASAQDIPI
jgi:GGDEF domain-containing protein